MERDEFGDSLFGKEQKAIDDTISRSIQYLIDEGYKKTDILLCLSWIIGEIASEIQFNSSDN